jgi:hypothetical protein
MVAGKFYSDLVDFHAQTRKPPVVRFPGLRTFGAGCVVLAKAPAAPKRDPGRLQQLVVRGHRSILPTDARDLAKQFLGCARAHFRRAPDAGDGCVPLDALVEQGAFPIGVRTDK